MKIKYIGTRDKYILDRNKIYIFDPYCEVIDPADIEFFLASPEVFIKADNEIKDTKKDEAIPEVKTDDKEGYKCGICGFVAKTEFGLMGHKRKHEK